MALGSKWYLIRLAVDGSRAEITDDCVPPGPWDTQAKAMTAARVYNTAHPDFGGDSYIAELRLDDPVRTPPAPKIPDLVVTAIRTVAPIVKDGDLVEVMVDVKNVGTGPQPAGEIVDVLVGETLPDGTQADWAWSDTYNLPVAPGATVSLRMLGGPDTNPDRPKFTVTGVGAHRLWALPNSGRRFPEVTASKPRYETTLTVVPARPPVVVPPVVVPPVVTDPGTPPPVVVAGGRAPLAWWLGNQEFAWMAAGNHGPSIPTIVGAGFKIVTCVNRYIDGRPVEDYQLAMWRKAVDAGLDVYPGLYAIMAQGNLFPYAALGDDAGWARVNSIVASLATKAHGAGCTGLVLDEENYDQAPDTVWNAKTSDVAGERVKMRARMRALGTAIVNGGISRVLVYPSSNGGWPGNYNDRVRADQPVPILNSYATSLFADALDGLRDAKLAVDFTDAVFHYGAQLRGYTWETGIAEAVRLGQVRFPGIGYGPMIWPDRVEHAGAFDPAEIEGAVRAGVKLSTGPVVVYEQFAYAGTTDAAWAQYFAAIKRGATT